jgi:uncharacterized membrane protein YgcG
MTLFLLALILVMINVFSVGCRDEPYDTNMSVPKGDPSFPQLTTSWVIDKAGVLSQATIMQGDAILQGLKEDSIAEVVVIVINGVKKPVEWSTHYGRWLGLGRKGRSTEGGNNGIVWLIRPDADVKMFVSVGRGLPKFTAVDIGMIMDKAKEYINFGNFDSGVMAIIEETDKILRELYEKKK